MSSNDFSLFITTMVGIFNRAFALLTSFRIAGVPLSTIFLMFIGFFIFVKVVRHISIGGGEE